MAMRAALVVCACLAAAAASELREEAAVEGELQLIREELAVIGPEEQQEAAVEEELIVEGAELRAARTAQCRALCLDEYDARTAATHGECFRSAGCLTCWEQCGSLNPPDDGPRTPCHLLPDCQEGGCRLACEFHWRPQAAPPAELPCRPRLTLRRSGAEARWALGARACAGPASRVVFLLLAGTADGWRELVQTSAESVLLVNVDADTPLRLLAVGRDGPLAAAEAHQPAQDGQTTSRRTQLPVAAGGWLLEAVSVAPDSSSMVLVRLGWERQPSAGAAPPQYLVTWELSGGGLKGHLYTDINSVTLSLWPESVYTIQVELLSVTSERSLPLVISTYRSAEPVEQRVLPSVYLAALGTALLLAAVAAAVALASRRYRWRPDRSAPLVSVLSSDVPQKSVPSPLTGAVVQMWVQPAPVSSATDNS